MSSSRPKTLRDESFIGQAGVNLVATRLNDMGYAWHPGNPSLDAGIDGFVELRDTTSGAALNLMLPVQSKATGQSWAAETSTSFEFACRERDLVYWLGGSHPVILVVSRPKDGEAYWVCVRDYFRDPQRRMHRKIVFDKQRQRFDQSAKAALLHLAVPNDGGYYTAPLPLLEPIYSNLLQVRTVPPLVYTARVVDTDPKVIGTRLREVGVRDIEWVLRGGRLLTVHDPSQRGWRTVVDLGTVETHKGSEWAALDFDTRADDTHDFINLLSRCLSTRLRPLGVRFDAQMRYYFFEASPDLTSRGISYRSLKHASSRVVFNRYGTKHGDATREWYRHSAFTGRFMRYDGTWYLEIVPNYHFTGDGSRALRFQASKRAGIKALERNGTVLGQVVMWADLLTPSVGDLFAPPEYPHLRFGELATFTLEAGINEHDWIGNEEPAEIRVADDAWKKLPLFSNDPSPYADDAPVPVRPAVLDDAVRTIDSRAGGGPLGVSARTVEDADLSVEQQEILAALAADLVATPAVEHLATGSEAAASPPTPVGRQARGGHGRSSSGRRRGPRT